jgi:hypothetical protein
MDDLTDDPLGRECLDNRDLIRLWVGLARDRVRVWVPAPCPERQEDE